MSPPPHEWMTCCLETPHTPSQLTFNGCNFIVTQEAKHTHSLSKENQLRDSKYANTSELLAFSLSEF